LKLAHLNLENFFLYDTKDLRSPEKSQDKVQWLANIVNEISPDILMLCEVGGAESLNLFNTKYLDNKFTVFLIPGNTDRGIEIGYLVKKSLAFSYQHISHREKLFSRDVSELRVYKNNNLELIILLVHLKSKWDREGNDPNGFTKRSQEVEKLLEIYHNLQTLYPSCPIIISGDLNGIAQKNNCEREFREIYKKTSLDDILELMNIPNESRITFVHFSKESRPEHMQLDYIFLPVTLQDKIKKEESGIYQYKNRNGIPLRIPQNPFERYALPSDHYPLVLSLDFLQ
jgi:endonuclease/exonuclease/phosphatase family metal-dependent hydrolase